MEGFDPAINYGPNDAGISALTIVLGIVGVIAISWLFGKIYEQLAKLFEEWIHYSLPLSIIEGLEDRIKYYLSSLIQMRKRH